MRSRGKYAVELFPCEACGDPLDGETVASSCVGQYWGKLLVHFL